MTKRKMMCGLPSPNGRSCSVGMTANEMKRATQSKNKTGRANTVQKGNKSFKMYQVSKGFSK